VSQPTTIAERFLAMHEGAQPLLLGNVWDQGSAKLLTSLGYEALATTSSGHAATLGRLDYAVGRDAALAHAGSLVGATAAPVSADLEDCFADNLDGVADTVTAAVACGLAGCSIEDWNPREQRLYDIDEAVARVEAAATAAHTGAARLVLTARAENYLRGRRDLDDTIQRLQRYQQAGADVLYAPALQRHEDIARLVASVERPVNVLALPGLPPIDELATIGVARVSVGGSFAFAALGAVASAASELLQRGTYGFTELAAAGARAAREAFA